MKWWDCLHKQAMTENLFYKIYNTDGQLLTDTMNMHGMMTGMDGENRILSNLITYDVTVVKYSNRKIQVLYPNRLLG